MTGLPERARQAAWLVVPISQPDADRITSIILQALQAAVAEEREACCRDVCEGCREGWLTEDIDGDLMHTIPLNHRDIKWRGTRTGCDAYAIRVRAALRAAESEASA